MSHLGKATGNQQDVAARPGAMARPVSLHMVSVGVELKHRSSVPEEAVNSLLPDSLGTRHISHTGKLRLRKGK